MRNKKGDLLNNILTTVIAIVGMVIIVFAAVKLYSVYANQDETNAKKTADTIEGKINLLEDGQIMKFTIRGVNDWFLTSWTKNDPDRPDKCYFKSCICMCKGEGEIITSETEGAGLWYNLGKLPALCQANGFCRFFDTEVVVKGKLYEGGLTVHILSGKLRDDGIFPYLTIEKDKLGELSASRKGNEIIVTYS